MRTDWVRLRSLLPHTDVAGEMFDGLPADVWQVHLLQLKTSWSQRDHALIRKMARQLDWSAAATVRAAVELGTPGTLALTPSSTSRRADGPSIAGGPARSSGCNATCGI